MGPSWWNQHEPWPYPSSLAFFSSFSSLYYARKMTGTDPRRLTGAVEDCPGVREPKLPYLEEVPPLTTPARMQVVPNLSQKKGEEVHCWTTISVCNSSCKLTDDRYIQYFVSPMSSFNRTCPLFFSCELEKNRNFPPFPC